MAGLGLDDHQVAGLDALAGAVDIDPFPGILEPDLEQVVVLLLADAFQPVVDFQLAAALTVGATGLAGPFRLGYRTTPETVVTDIFIDRCVHLKRS